MTEYISPKVLRAKVMEYITSLQAQHFAAQNAWRDIAKRMDALREEYKKLQAIWLMAQQRKEALMDMLSLIDELEKR